MTSKFPKAALVRINNSNIDLVLDINEKAILLKDDLNKSIQNLAC